MIATPKKPFAEYRWRWATFMPTEGLNEPPVYLGVLRAMRDCHGKLASSQEFYAALQNVEKETKDRVRTAARLARSTERNVLRNSQQYWKFLGLLESTEGGIKLSPFGLDVADGRLSQQEFAAATVNTLTLPHASEATEVAQWGAAGLKIKPLLLILQVLFDLAQHGGDAEGACLTRDELVGMVIPMAGDQWTVPKQVEAIRAHRKGQLDISGWPDCTLGANDHRMAREFLLFLAHHGFVTVRTDSGVEKFFLNIESLEMTEALDQLIAPDPGPMAAAKALRTSPLFLDSLRKRVMVSVLYRPSQPAFRRAVLGKAVSQCLITGERMEEVLEAAHIIPVSRRGTDETSNGFCLRTDIHTLFDTGHLRIRPTGEIVMSDRMKSSADYSKLPSSVAIPGWVSKEAVEWRWKYE